MYKFGRFTPFRTLLEIENSLYKEMSFHWSAEKVKFTIPLLQEEGVV
jgi:hypothetical protein